MISGGTKQTVTASLATLSSSSSPSRLANSGHWSAVDADDGWLRTIQVLSCLGSTAICLTSSSQMSRPRRWWVLLKTGLTSERADAIREPACRRRRDKPISHSIRPVWSDWRCIETRHRIFDRQPVKYPIGYDGSNFVTGQTSVHVRAGCLTGHDRSNIRLSEGRIFDRSPPRTALAGTYKHRMVFRWRYDKHPSSALCTTLETAAADQLTTSTVARRPTELWIASRPTGISSLASNLAITDYQSASFGFRSTFRNLKFTTHFVR